MKFCILSYICGILFSYTGVRSENVTTFLDQYRLEYKNCVFPPKDVMNSRDIFCKDSNKADSICYLVILASQEICRHDVTSNKKINIPTNFTEMGHYLLQHTLCQTFKSLNASGFTNTNLSQFLVKLKNDDYCLEECIHGYQPKNDCIVLMWASLIMSQIEAQLTVATNDESSVSVSTNVSAETTSKIVESVVSYLTTNGSTTVAVGSVKNEATLEGNSPESSQSGEVGEDTSSPKQSLDGSNLVKHTSPFNAVTNSSQVFSTSQALFGKQNVSSEERTSAEVTDSASEFIASNVAMGYKDGTPTNEIYQDLTSDEKPDDKLTAKPSNQPHRNEGSGVFSYFQRNDQDDSSSHFMSYFIFTCFVCVIAYILYHNKKKVLAFLVEGRRSNSGRRRPNSSNYSKLDSKLDDVLCSDQTTGPKTTVFY